MKKIFVLMVIVMLCSFPVMIADTIGMDYGADVYSCINSSTNFSIEGINTDFGSIQTGKSKILTPSFIINNTNSRCNISVSALFTTNVSVTYGFKNNSNVISANDFRLNNIPLNSTGDAVYIGIVTNGTLKDYNATLSIPVTQEPAIYNGSIELIIVSTT